MERQMQLSTANSLRIPILLTVAAWIRIAVVALGVYYWRLELASFETKKAIAMVVGGWRNTTYKHWSSDWELGVLILMLFPYLISTIVMIISKRKGMLFLSVASLATLIIDIYVIVDFNLSYSIHGAVMPAFLINIGIMFAIEDYWRQGLGEKEHIKQEGKPWYTSKRNFLCTAATSALAPFLIASSLAASTFDKSFSIGPMMFIGFLQACYVSLDHFWRWNIIVMFTAMIARALYTGLSDILDPRVGISGIFGEIVVNAIIYCIFTLPVAGIIYYFRKKIGDDGQKTG